MLGRPLLLTRIGQKPPSISLQWVSVSNFFRPGCLSRFIGCPPGTLSLFIGARWAPHASPLAAHFEHWVPVYQEVGTQGHHCPGRSSPGWLFVGDPCQTLQWHSVQRLLPYRQRNSSFIIILGQHKIMETKWEPKGEKEKWKKYLKMTLRGRV
jgi:hypothetical protein